MAGNGPPPKRSEERRRRNKTDASGRPYEDVIEAVVIDQQAELLAEVVIPSPDPTWHPIARMFWDSLLKSGQSMWYEPSDWAVAFLVTESMSRDLNPQVVGITETGEVVKDTIPLKGASLSAYQKAFTALLVNEGDRRKLRLELSRQREIDKLTSGEKDAPKEIVKSREDLFK